MIERIQAATRSAADDMDGGVERVSRGLALADEAGSTIQHSRTAAARCSARWKASPSA
jgi:methyl-accepting chemotaxis protein